MSKQLNKKGFTLIEVVLVLAIGGLIFLLAFIAFRQASVNRRDTQRRSDASRFVSEVSNYSGDANGRVPGQSGALTVDQFVENYLGGAEFRDPQGETYVQSTDAITNESDPGEYQYVRPGKCEGNTATSTGAGQRDFAVVMKLEKGQVCRSNSDS